MKTDEETGEIIMDKNGFSIIGSIYIGEAGLMLAKIAENSNFKGYRSKKKKESRVLKDQFEKTMLISILV